MDEGNRHVYGLLGSGEFDPWAEEVDRWLLDRATSRSQRVLILPTASAPEGDDVFDRWGRKGLKHYERLGVSAEVLPLKTREDALREDLAAELADARLIFFSGGNPRHLVEVLRDTPFWGALLEAMADGTAFGGCSAGVAFLGDRAPDSSRMEMDPSIYGHGIGVFAGVDFSPHWDALDRYRPGMQRFIRENLPEGVIHVLIDEDTALVGDGEDWTVMGRGFVTVGRGETERGYRAGESFSFAEAGAPA